MESNAIKVSTRYHKELHLVLEPVGRRMIMGAGTATTTSWCEPEHREALGTALAQAKKLAAQMSKAQIIDALGKLGRFPFSNMKEKKAGLACSLQIALIDAWVPQIEV